MALCFVELRHLIKVLKVAIPGKIVLSGPKVSLFVLFFVGLFVRTQKQLHGQITNLRQFFPDIDRRAHVTVNIQRRLVQLSDFQRPRQCFELGSAVRQYRAVCRFEIALHRLRRQLPLSHPFG